MQFTELLDHDSENLTGGRSFKTSNYRKPQPKYGMGSQTQGQGQHNGGGGQPGPSETNGTLFPPITLTTGPIVWDSTAGIISSGTISDNTFGDWTFR